MSWLRFFRRRRADAELQQELDDYLVEEIAENLARVCLPKKRVVRLRSSSGVLERSERDFGRKIPIATIDNLRRDLQYALRTPGAITRLCVHRNSNALGGIGATTAIFRLVNTVLLRPLPFPEQEQLMWLSQQDHSLPGVAAESFYAMDYCQLQSAQLRELL